jgi:hypothetical protein
VAGPACAGAPPGPPRCAGPYLRAPRLATARSPARHIAGALSTADFRPGAAAVGSRCRGAPSPPPTAYRSYQGRARPCVSARLVFAAHFAGGEDGDGMRGSRSSRAGARAWAVPARTCQVPPRRRPRTADSCRGVGRRNSSGVPDSTRWHHRETRAATPPAPATAAPGCDPGAVPFVREARATAKRAPLRPVGERHLLCDAAQHGGEFPIDWWRQRVFGERGQPPPARRACQQRRIVVGHR